ncbi:hypothetical protein TIFTF001_003903 [Ficus carica]|uniref:Uncharacterized protein n=1 Tax=Ficus carica TaxID=3494 RepID=A0AA87ZFS4_FICCA|nr:hypothetical protein TIFTF001_003903 [Ficus carica]
MVGFGDQSQGRGRGRVSELGLSQVWHVGVRFRDRCQSLQDGDRGRVLGLGMVVGFLDGGWGRALE